MKNPPLHPTKTFDMKNNFVKHLKHSLNKSFWSTFFQKGWKRIKKTKIYGFSYFKFPDFLYQIEIFKQRVNSRRRREMKSLIHSFSYKPLISVVMPVYNVERQWLVEAIESVFKQIYTDWELCIADDASPAPHIKEVLEHYRKKDPRVKVVYLPGNVGIALATNEALALATGEFVAFMDHDDRLNPGSLVEVVDLLNREPLTDLIYTDEDKLSMGGLRLRPVRKQAWDPSLLLSYNYICHLVVCRSNLIHAIGRLRPGFEGSQDYDFLLRITELTSRVVHIPKILYHWRMIPGSAAALIDAKAKAFDHARKALQEALIRRGIKGKIEDGHLPGTFRVDEEKQ